MQTVPTKLTEKLVIEIEDLIKDGWYANKSELIRDAVRDLINKTKMQKLETAIKEDVEWGLHGKWGLFRYWTYFAPQWNKSNPFTKHIQ